MIINKSNNQVLAHNKKILRSVLAKAKGLMFSKKIENTGYIFVFAKEQIMDLHMFLVFFPIDVVFLNKAKKVIEIKENFLPFSIYISKKKASSFIELPKGTVKRTRTKIGHMISLDKNTENS